MGQNGLNHLSTPDGSILWSRPSGGIFGKCRKHIRLPILKHNLETNTSVPTCVEFSAPKISNEDHLNVSGVTLV